MEIRDVIFAFLANNKINFKQMGGFLCDLFRGYTPSKCDFTIKTVEDVISAFESMITEEEKKMNGSVYTPLAIRKYMCGLVVSPISASYIDISCGCGSFLYTIAETLVDSFNFTVKEALNMLHGVDICPEYVKQTKAILALFALEKEGLYVHSNDLDIKTGDSLDLVTSEDVYDVVIGNPPYVSASNMSPETLRKVNEMTKKVADSLPQKKSDISFGKAELYIPFFYVGISLLSERGRLLYITPNSWLNSQNGVVLRNMLTYLSGSEIEVSVRDFGSNKVFGNLGVYSCITDIQRKPSSCVSYSKLSMTEEGVVEKETPFAIPTANLDCTAGWSMTDRSSYSIIRKIEEQPRHLSDYKVKNGIATNANDIFVLKATSGDCDYYSTDNGLMIERGVTRKIVKATKIKTEKDIEESREFVIFPYDGNGNIIPEDLFKSCYPNAYNYLLANKEKLGKRDKGKKEYPAWYAFGRSQAIRDRGMKLIFPQMSDKPYFVFSDDEELVFYSGGAIYGDDKEELLRLKVILESPVMEFYIKSVSKPYSSNFYSYGERYFGKFGIPDITEDEWNLMSILEKGEELDRFICEKFGINYKNLKEKLL